MRFLRLVAFVSLLIVGPAAANFAIFQTSIPSQTFTPSWQSLKMGGGGLMNNLWVARSDGTLLSSSNTYGAYLYKTSGTCAGADNGGWGTTNAAPCQEQLFTQTSAPLTLTRVNLLQQGVLEIGGCNSDTNTAYAFFDRSLYVTTNLKAAASSRTWAKTPLTNTIDGNQGISAGTGHVIGCDPNNPDLVYANTPAGVNVSVNGKSGTSATFSIVSTAKVGTTGTLPTAIAFDPTSAIGTCAHYSGSPTCTLHFWIFTFGSGVRETYDGGNTFTLTTGGPTAGQGPGCGQGGYCFTLREDKFGKVWAARGDNKLYKYTPNGTAGGGTWTNVTPVTNNNIIVYAAFDETASSAATMRVAAMPADGNIALSTDGGGIFTAWAGNSFAASGAQPSWLGNANQGVTLFIAAQDSLFDTSGNLWVAAGLGNWSIASASVAVNATWQSNNVGIENMVGNHVDAPSGGAPAVGVWDKGFFTLANPDAFPSRYWEDFVYSTSVGQVNDGWAWDWASADPTAFTGWAGRQSTIPGKSADGGVTWSAWASTGAAVTNIGGAIAASTATNWIWVPRQTDNHLWFTTNGGTSWAASTITPTGNLSGATQHGFQLAADRVNANTFCLIDGGTKIWSSTNSGATFTNVSTGAFSTITYNDALKAVPGQAATFYYAGGNGGGDTTTFTFYKITKTTNECDTVSTVNANITNVYGFGYGAPKPGGNGFPTIYYYGWLSGTLGLYQINNGGATATLIDVPASQQTWPNNSSDFVQDVSGDMNVYGRVYVGFSGSSFAYIDVQDACPWVGFDYSVVKPNQNLTGASVTLTAKASGKVPVTGVNFYLDGSTQIGSTQTGAGPYSVSFNASGQSVGAHTLTVSAIGNGCNSYNSTSNRTIMPVATH